jgi:hypothetical protein
MDSTPDLGGSNIVKKLDCFTQRIAFGQWAGAGLPFPLWTGRLWAFAALALGMS